MNPCPKQCRDCIHRSSIRGEEAVCMFIDNVLENPCGFPRGFPIARVMAGEPCPRRAVTGHRYSDRPRELAGKQLWDAIGR